MTAAFCRGAALLGGKKEKITTLSFSKVQQNIELNTLLGVDSNSECNKKCYFVALCVCVCGTHTDKKK